MGQITGQEDGQMGRRTDGCRDIDDESAKCAPPTINNLAAQLFSLVFVCVAFVRACFSDASAYVHPSVSTNGQTYGITDRQMDGRKRITYVGR